MSGYPLNFPSDAAKLRQNYLANLSLQANINDMNLQANKIFKKTGQTPTQPTDNRTTAEKLADVERLKVEVRGELTPIADGTQADSIVQQLQPNELQFLAQHIDEIVKIVKPKYKYGVLADVFVTFLRAYIAKADATDEVDFGLQQVAGNRLILGMQQIADNLINVPTLDQIENAINFGGIVVSTRLQIALKKRVDNLKQILPDKSFLIHVAQTQDEVTKNTMQQALSDALQELPTNRQIEILLEQLNDATKRRDQATADDLGAKLNQLLTVQPATEEQLRDVKRLVEESSGQIRNLADTLINVPTLNQIENAIEAGGVVVSTRLQIALKKRVDNLKQILPDKQFLVEVSRQQDEATKNTIQQALSDALQELPTKNQIEILLQQLNQATARRDQATADDIGAKLNQLLTVQPATEAQLRDVKRLVEESRSETAQLRDLYLSEPEKLKQLIKDEISSVKTSGQQISVQMRGQIINDVTQAIQQGNIENKTEMAQFIGQLLQAQAKGPAPPRGAAAEEPLQATPMAALPAGITESKIRSLYKPTDDPTLDTNRKKEAYIDELWKYIKKPNENKGDFLRSTTGKIQPKSKDELNRAIKEINKRLRPIGWGEDNPVGVGEGFGRIRGRGIIADNANYSEGIMQTNHYIPFGRFFINTHKLNDNIIAIKRPTGGNVSGMPVERISSELGGVLRTIIGGGQPNFNQLEKLSQDEKVYLHKIAKHSNILDRLSIPTPNKDDDDKDINQFEIMKGEILSGNDSADLVKKFKLLIIKMTKKDLLPKGQAKELLLELATLGY